MLYRRCSYIRLLCHQTEQFMPFTLRSPAFQPTRNTSIDSPDLQDLFTIPRIQNLLRLITFRDPATVHKPRFKSDKMHSIKVLSDAELKTVLEYSSAYTAQRLQFPPILAARSEPKCPEECDEILIKSDPELQGILPSNNKMVFTDISLGESRRNRLIMVREPTGRLRHAVASERDRINQVYFPLEGRRLRMPMMFEGRYLKDMLDRRQFVYLLDRACAQFEPDDPQFIAVCHAVYDRVGQLAWTPITSTSTPADRRPGDAAADWGSGVQGNPLRALRHTRYYGPMALYLTVQLGQPGALLYEAITCQHYGRVGWILLLCSIVKPQGPFARALAKSPHKLPKDENEGNSSSNDREINMSAADVENVLACLRLFIDVEPLSSDQKALLHHHLLECQKCIRLDQSHG